MAAAVTAEALSLTLEEDIPQDGYDHYDGDDQEHSNGHLYRAWERTGRMRHAKGLSGSDPPPSLHRMDKDHDVTCRSRTPNADLQESCFQKPRAALTEDNQQAIHCFPFLYLRQTSLLNDTLWVTSGSLSTWLRHSQVGVCGSS